MTPEAPKTLLDAVRYYTDPKVTFQTMIAVKWPDGKITCPKCGCDKIGVMIHDAPWPYLDAMHYTPWPERIEPWSPNLAEYLFLELFYTHYKPSI